MRTGKKIILAIIVSFAIPSFALADTTDTPQSKKAKRLNATLQAMGLNDPTVMKLVQEVNNNVKDGYLSLYEERVPGGHVTLHYELKGVGIKQTELKFTPDDSNMAYTARTNAVMASYELHF